MGNVWMMRPTAFDAICGTLSQAMREGFRMEDSPDRGLRWAMGGKPKQQKTVAMMGLYGMIDKRSSWMMDFMGGTSTDAFGAVFDQLIADPNVKGIVIDTDSPGGSAVGTYELSKKIYDSREAKPIVAVSNAEMCSAAYYIASAAHMVFATPSAGTGSIGVWSAAAEYSRALEQDGVKVHVWRSEGSPMKASFLPWQEFSKEAIKDEQVEVDRIYDEFLSSVARNRGVSTAVAQKQFGEGRVLSSKAAVDAGLVDRVATLEDVVGKMMSGKITMSTVRSREEMDVVFSEPDDSWKDDLETAKLHSRLRRKGVSV